MQNRLAFTQQCNIQYMLNKHDIAQNSNKSFASISSSITEFCTVGESENQLPHLLPKTRNFQWYLLLIQKIRQITYFCKKLPCLPLLGASFYAACFLHGWTDSQLGCIKKQSYTASKWAFFFFYCIFALLILPFLTVVQFYPKQKQDLGELLNRLYSQLQQNI